MSKGLLAMMFLVVSMASAANLPGEVILTPNPATVGQQVTLSGCGYVAGLAGNTTTVTVQGPLGTGFGYMSVTADGCLVPADNIYPNVVGEYTFEIRQRLHGNHDTLMGSAVLIVE